MKKIIYLYLLLTFLLPKSILAQNCELAVLANDLSKATTTEFKAIVNETNGFDAWQLLNKEATALRTDITELNLVSKNLDAIKNAGGYLKWKGLNNGVGNLNFSLMELPKALQHVKFRDLTNSTLREIKGLHDAIEFNKLKIVKAIGNADFKFPIGKTLDEVEEIVILKYEENKVPGVTNVEYRVPTTDGKYTVNIDGIDVNKGYTTGATKGIRTTENFLKTIYDPEIWTDAKLEKALKEALQDCQNNGKLVENKFTSGLTKEGFEIEFIVRDGKVQTFYFK
jgi:hypothetical protein